MRRIRLSTLILLVVIAALSLSLVAQHRAATRREAALRAQLARKLLSTGEDYIDQVYIPKIMPEWPTGILPPQRSFSR